jgi:hypothetical protein
VVKKNKQSTTNASEIMNVMRFNLSQVDIILLESIEVTNTTAIILSCQTSIDLKQKQNFVQFSGQVSEISMLLTNYDRYIGKQEIDAYIMKPTDLSVNGTINGDSVFSICFCFICCNLKLLLSENFLYGFNY